MLVLTSPDRRARQRCRLFHSPHLHTEVVGFQLLEVLSERMSSDAVETLLREVGRRIATGWHVPHGDLRMRLEAVVEILNELGGLAALEEYDSQYSIRGYSCPLAAVVPGHPEACRLTETFLTELVSVPVQEHCGRSGKLQCHFTVQSN